MGKGEETRSMILDHAVEMASRLGLEGISVGGLAGSLSMSKSGLYAHFGSKDALQVAVIDHAADQFTEAVLRRALKAPRGEPRVTALFELWIAWFETVRETSGCLFVSAASELDDRPGEARTRLVSQMKDLLEFIANVVGVAMREKHFREDLDAEQFAFEAYGVLLAHHQSARLLEDGRANARAWIALRRLIDDARIG